MSLTPAINFSPVSLTPLNNIHSRLSPRIFEKNRNNPKSILRGQGDTDLRKNLKSKSRVRLPLNGKSRRKNTLCLTIFTETHSLGRRKIRLKAIKMSSSKKLTYKGTLRQVFICLRPPSLLGFCLGWSSNLWVENTDMSKCTQEIGYLQLFGNCSSQLPRLH